MFQTFDWVSVWQRNIGVRKASTPRSWWSAATAPAHCCMILPLAIEKFGAVRRLTWLASELCDYNTPLLAAGFFAAASTLSTSSELWREIAGRLQQPSGLPVRLRSVREDAGDRSGTQANPMLGLPVMRNASNAYMTQLSGDWERFYTAKRSSSTRRRDRTKRKKLGEFGEVKFVDPGAADEDVAASLDILMQPEVATVCAHGRAGYLCAGRAIRSSTASGHHQARTWCTSAGSTSARRRRRSISG